MLRSQGLYSKSKDNLIKGKDYIVMPSEKIERFEDLIAWQKARQLTKEIYLVTKTGDFSRDYELKAQIRKASVSMMSNTWT